MQIARLLVTGRDSVEQAIQKAQFVMCYAALINQI